MMMRTAATEGTRDGIAGLICVNEGVPLHFEGSVVNVIAVDGSAWITREGDGNDYVVGPGDELRLVGEGLVVIEALTPLACVRVMAS